MPAASRALTQAPDPRAAVQLALPVAIILHLALLALLSVHWTDAPQRDDNVPMEVDLIAEVAPKSSAPIISTSPPPPKLGETEEEDVTLPAPPPPVKASPPPPVKAPTPKTIPVKAPPVKAPAAKAPPSKAPPAKAPPSKAPPTKAPPVNAAPAAATAAEVKKSIQVAVDGEIRPFWNRNAPSGVDVELLKVTLEIQLNSDGSIADIRQIGDLVGTTESNAPQQKLFVERAIRSIRQAAPFSLPGEYYESWKVVRQPFAARRRN